MELHTLHGVVDLAIRGVGVPLSDGLRTLLADLSFVRTDLAVARDERLLVDVHESGGVVPPFLVEGRLVASLEGLQAFEHGQGVYLTDGSSVLHVDPRRGRATARIAPAFRERPSLHQQRFWTFGILRLLRHRGLHALHAAGVMTASGARLLIVGPSGCGKSTLTIGLVRAGGRFLSDDALLLRSTGAGVEAMALRKPFSIASESTGRDAQRLRPTAPDATPAKRRLDMCRAYPERSLDRFHPDRIVLPQITNADTSTCCRVSRSEALHALLAQSGDFPEDRTSATARLDVLTQLLRQSSPSRVRAGRDLERDPAGLDHLLNQERNGTWHA